MAYFYHHLNDFLILIPLIPLIAFALNGIFGRYFSRSIIHFIGVFSIFLSFVLSALVLFRIGFDSSFSGEALIFSNIVPWIQSESLVIHWGLYVDQLSAVMICIVTGVGFLIHLYSVGYMADDPGIHKFFAYMNLFTAAMLVLVMADNLILMFLGWEGVGLCSYLLIAFWYQKKEFSAAGKKAFIFNRIGDAAFIIGGILLFWTFGTLSFVSYDTQSGKITGLPEALEHAQTYVTEDDSQTPVYDERTGLPFDKTVPLIQVLPLEVKSHEFQDVVLSHLNTSEAAFILNYYKKDNEQDVYTLTHHLSENDTEKVLAILQSIEAYQQIKQQWITELHPIEANLALPSRFLGIPFAVVILLVTLLFFIGATGKSAQIPLYTWLPDAMAGPTPVSALIHAATMVTAGVYMVGRLFYLFQLSEETRLIIILVGGVTSVLAGMIAISQNDIKKVLAYSTISQLGYMFMAMAASVYALGIFHVMTHAFFKALLFLSAGSVILALHHHLKGEDGQDITKMGGLGKFIPITFICFLIGAFSLSGIIPFSGFFSKDQILEGVFFEYGWVLWLVGIVSAMFTAGYTWRLMGLTFFGKTRVPGVKEHPVKETSKTVLFVIIVLGFLSLIGGFVGLPAFISHTNGFVDFLAPVFGPMHHAADVGAMPIILMLISLVLALGIGFLFWRRYSRENPLDGSWVKKPLGAWLQKISNRKFYVDELYDLIITKPFEFLAEKFWKFIDTPIFNRLFLDAPGFIVKKLGSALRLMQTGSVNLYALMILLGVIALLIYILYMIL